jgi:hypothetical protein
MKTLSRVSPAVFLATILAGVLPDGGQGQAQEAERQAVSQIMLVEYKLSKEQMRAIGPRIVRPKTPVSSSTKSRKHSSSSSMKHSPP